MVKLVTENELRKMIREALMSNESLYTNDDNFTNMCIQASELLMQVAQIFKSYPQYCATLGKVVKNALNYINVNAEYIKFNAVGNEIELIYNITNIGNIDSDDFNEMINNDLRKLTRQCIKMVQQDLKNMYGDNINWNIFQFNISNPYYSPETGELIVNIINGHDLTIMLDAINKLTDINL